MKKESGFDIYFMWLIVALFFCYQYILRATPNIMVEQFRSTFMIRAEEFATLGMLYMLTYSIIQIPLGVFVDKVGIRKTVLLSISICIACSFISAIAEHFAIMQICRVFIGLGSASAFMCAVKLISDCFPNKHKALFAGITLSLGTCSVLFTGNLLLETMEIFSWRTVLAGIGACGIILLSVMALVLHPKAMGESKTYKKGDIFTSVVKVIKDPIVLLYALLAVGLFAPFSAFAELWGTAFIKQKYGLPAKESTQIALTMYLGMAVGSFIIPLICEKLNKIKEGILLSTVCCTVCILGLMYGDGYSVLGVKGLLFAIGFFGGAEMLCFTGALTRSTSRSSGEIIGVVNTGNMLGAAIMDQVIGSILDARWSGKLDAIGLRVYDTEDFLTAFTSLLFIMAICIISGFILMYKKD